MDSATLSSSLTASVPLSSAHTRSRIVSIDILRGAVMIIMALDHARDFWSPTAFQPEDLSQAGVLLFVTRWITHFCAPTFVFLSGVSIYLQQQRLRDRGATSMYLLKRGLWLIIMEVVVLSFAMQFSFNLIFLMVIWVIGCGMIAMAAILWVPRKVTLIAGLLIIVAHNLFVDVMPVTAENALLAFMHNSPFMLVMPPLPPILVTYAWVPWIAVMAVGYAAGVVFEYDASKRKRVLRTAGQISLALFVVLRGLNVYGDPSPWAIQERGIVFTVLSFFNVTKYPPSVLFLLLTLGVALIVLSVTENVQGRLVNVLRTFGAVPFFYYLVHMPLLSGSSVVWAYLRFDTAAVLSFLPRDAMPQGYEPSLLRAYAAWLAVVVLLYFPCRWYARYKREHNQQGWLTYL